MHGGEARRVVTTAPRLTAHLVQPKRKAEQETSSARTPIISRFFAELFRFASVRSGEHNHSTANDEECNVVGIRASRFSASGRQLNRAFDHGHTLLIDLDQRSLKDLFQIPRMAIRPRHLAVYSLPVRIPNRPSCHAELKAQERSSHRRSMWNKF
jgi:hypothetical protein